MDTKNDSTRVTIKKPQTIPAEGIHSIFVDVSDQLLEALLIQILLDKDRKAQQDSLESLFYGGVSCCVEDPSIDGKWRGTFVTFDYTEQAEKDRINKILSIIRYSDAIDVDRVFYAEAHACIYGDEK